MTIAYEASGNAASGFASSLTFALDAGSNADRVVLVFASTDRGSASTIDSATYAGVSMTALSGFLSSPTGIDGRLFYLVGAASGSNNVVITYSDSGIRPRAVAAAYSGVSGVSDAQNVSPSYGSTISATVTSASGDLVVLIGCQLGRTSVAPSSPAVERFDAAMPSSTVYGYVWEEAGASSVTIDGTAPGSTEWWAAACNLQAAGGTSYTLTVSPASIGLSGQAVGPLAGRKVSISPAGVAVTGATVNARVGRTLSVSSGTVALAGATVGARAGRVLAVSPGSVALAGADVDLQYASGYTLAVSPASIAFTGGTVGFKRNRALVVEPGVVTFGGADVTLRYSGEAPPSAPVVGGGASLYSSTRRKTLIVNGRAYVIADDGSDESVLESLLRDEPKPKKKAGKKKARKTADIVVPASVDPPYVPVDIPSYAVRMMPAYPDVRAELVRRAELDMLRMLDATAARMLREMEDDDEEALLLLM